MTDTKRKDRLVSSRIVKFWLKYRTLNRLDIHFLYLLIALLEQVPRIVDSVCVRHISQEEDS